MIGRKILAAEFPESGVKITHVDDISGSVSDFNAVADSVRRPHQHIDPADEAGDRSLQREAEDERDQADRDNGGIPIDEDDRDHYESNSKNYNQSQYPLEVVLCDA